MHVGVEKSVAQGMAQEGLHQGAPERRQIRDACREPGAVGERRAVDPFEGENLSRVRSQSTPARGSRDRPSHCRASPRSRRLRAAGPSIVTERASVSTTSTNLSRRASAEWRSLRAAK
jgi:hypothetical protein